MNVKDVMDELGEKLETIPQLRVYPYTVDKVTPPSAVIGLPDGVTFDQTYGRGSDTMSLLVYLFVGAADDQASQTQLAAYANGSGDRSVKAVLDSTDDNVYTACDEVTVKSVEFDFYTSAGVKLLGAEFTVDIAGKGQVS